MDRAPPSGELKRIRQIGHGSFGIIYLTRDAEEHEVWYHSLSCTDPLTEPLDVVLWNALSLNDRQLLLPQFYKYITVCDKRS